MRFYEFTPHLDANMAAQPIGACEGESAMQAFEDGIERGTLFLPATGEPVRIAARNMESGLIFFFDVQAP